MDDEDMNNSGDETIKKSGQYTTERYENLQDSYNTILLRLDPTPTLMEIRRLLMRQTKWDAQSNTWVQPKGAKPMLKEEGIDELLLELRGRMSVDKVLGKLQEERIKMIVRICGEVILEYIFFDNEKYEISEGDYTKIFWQIVQNIDMFIRRSINGTENELITKSFAQREMITRHDEGRSMSSPAPKSKGLFGFFGGK